MSSNQTTNHGTRLMGIMHLLNNVKISVCSTSGHVLANEGYQFVLRTTPTYVSIPPNQKSTMAKDG